MTDESSYTEKITPNGDGTYQLELIRDSDNTTIAIVNNATEDFLKEVLDNYLPEEE